MASERALTDSSTKYFLRLHAEHLRTINGDPSGGLGGRDAMHKRFAMELREVGPRDGAAMRLGCDSGFDVMSSYFSCDLFSPSNPT
eukprot:COSAG05_NODE_341_length_11060_cov_29.709424_10_plen_86_part_00